MQKKTYRVPNSVGYNVYEIDAKSLIATQKYKLFVIRQNF